tara:strand:- start:331 stop:1425 length:1095 start_codon:yes stop_codon:yes gene_type:complete
MINIPHHISREIILSFSESQGFKKWMKKYITIKKYCRLKNLYFENNRNLKAMIANIEKELYKRKGILLNYKDFTNYTYLSYVLFLERKIFSNEIKFQRNFKNSLLNKSIKDNIFSTYSLNTLEIFIDKFYKDNVNQNSFSSSKKVIRIFAPVCPDYETYLDSNGKQRYSFDGIGSGIGLVGSKLIEKYPILEKSFKNSDLNYELVVLVGDFEATKQNLDRLNISKEQFNKKIKNSCKKYHDDFNLFAYGFAEFFGGINSWNSRIKTLKKDLNLYTFSDLHDCMPNINHNSIFASRIALYKKWTKNSDEMISIFISQTAEYILMGCLVESFHRPSILLTCDHKAMLPYYAAFTKSLPILSLNNVY